MVCCFQKKMECQTRPFQNGAEIHGHQRDSAKGGPCSKTLVAFILRVCFLFYEVGVGDQRCLRSKVGEQHCLRSTVGDQRCLRSTVGDQRCLRSTVRDPQLETSNARLDPWLEISIALNEQSCESVFEALFEFIFGFQRSRTCHLEAFFFHEYGRRVGMVPRSSLKEGKSSQMVEKRTKAPKPTQTKHPKPAGRISTIL